MTGVKVEHQPRASIIIPNLNGRVLLESCLISIQNLNYSANAIECIVVDNGSIDGSMYFVQKNFPDVRCINLAENKGFAEATNIGAEQAKGEILFMLNNDAMPDEDCLLNLVAPIVSGDAVCTTAQIINTQRTHKLFAGGGMNFHGIAFQSEEGEEYQPVDTESQTNEACLFPCGGAMAIKRQVFIELGGFDKDFFAYFEDVDLGWRLWLMGHNVLYVPSALVTHAQSSTSQYVDLSKLRVLHIRNPLMMIYKNYAKDSLSVVWPVAWMLTSQRTFYLTGLGDTSQFRIDNEPQLADINEAKACNSDEQLTMNVPMLALSDMVAINDCLQQFDRLQDKRASIQSQRVRSDQEILPMFKEPFRYCEDNQDFCCLQDQLCQQFGIHQLFDYK